MTIDSDSARFSQALRSAIIWPLGVFFAAILLLVVAILALLSEISWSTHSYQVLSDVHVCENMLIAGQDDVRGYLLTGDKAYITSYQQHRDRATTELARIKQLVSDNADQEHNLKDVIDAKEAWVQHAEIMINQQAKPAPVVPEWVKLGSTIEDQIRTGFDRFTNAEVQLRDTRLHNVKRMKTVLAVAGGILAALLVFTIVYQVRRQMMELATNYRMALDTAEQRQAGSGPFRA